MAVHPGKQLRPVVRRRVALPVAALGTDRPPDVLRCPHALSRPRGRPASVEGYGLNIAFACNKPENGQFSGAFDMVSIGEVTLEGPFVTIRRLSRQKVRIGRIILRYTQWSEWVGNWCWDELNIHQPAKLLKYLQGRGWNCIHGPEPFFEAFNGGQQVREEDLEEVSV